MDESKTPLLDELEEGQWPSFVEQLKEAAVKSPAAADLLLQLEKSYEDNTGHWKRGGIVGVRGYGGGVVGRYSAMPEEFPGVKEFHTLRVNEPAGFYYTTEKLRQLCDVWDRYGSGLLNLHGSTGDIILLGATTANLQPCFDALSEIGFDLGGSGSALRTVTCCVGPSRCEHGCIDTMDITQTLTQHFQNEIHRPSFPYKFKVKCSGCPNDCAAASARSDLAIIGLWRDDLRIDQDGGAAVRGRGTGPLPGGAPPLPHLGLGLGREVAGVDAQRRRLRALHGLHQPHAQGPPRGQGARRGLDDRRQGAGGQRRHAGLGARALHGDEAPLYRDHRVARRRSSTIGAKTARAANASAN